MALISSNDFINRFGDFLALLLYLFTPWTAINLIDFYIVRKGHYSIREIFNPSGMYGRLWHRLPRHDPILQYPDVPGTGGAR
jgi:purine-cytosine permease-like protein